ncbi:aminoglycoside phosphotransferase family protein [Paenibacillus allorhizosphaerae]|uniref:Aminoglycoside phosphotransferase domain-containing protein n=1 Tax=Paenibacillus allorhizosphaerae TaxID=2849866 RepID=A0ABM8VIN7_9BACL|nr:aminoglycoside phosphotransferase family protein [Paenibacillus allorhizosphaerae]CAG7644386.1 hypothetical protein PAECIP111802_03249 [Paenibacillus allorhizosphaerae]
METNGVNDPSNTNEQVVSEQEVLSADKSVSREGNVVLRPSGPWTPNVHDLLKSLKRDGFSHLPDVVGSGMNEDGREMLSYVEGEFVHPGPWSDEALMEVGRMLRRLHDTAASYVPADGAVWQPWFLRELGGTSRIVSHGDIAPWNMVTRDGMPVALIDWEFAGPVDPMAELARVCWLFPQLHDDDVAEKVGLPPAAIRAKQVRLLVDAYGLAAKERLLLLDRIIEVAVREAAEEAVEAGITMESIGPQWGLAWRIRAAAWMLRNRRILEQALA